MRSKNQLTPLSPSAKYAAQKLVEHAQGMPLIPQAEEIQALRKQDRNVSGLDIRCDEPSAEELIVPEEDIADAPSEHSGDDDLEPPEEFEDYDSPRSHSKSRVHMFLRFLFLLRSLLERL